MTIVKQMEIRDNIKKYFDIAYSGEPVIVPRKDNKNVVIISEDAFKEYERYKNNIEYLKNVGQLHQTGQRRKDDHNRSA